MAQYYLNSFKPDFDISADGKCLIFQLASTKEPRSWYVRVRRSNGSYFQASLKERNRAIAIRKAYEIFSDFTTAERKGVIYGKNTFSRVFARWRNEYHLNELRKISVVSRYSRYLCWFDDFEIHNIKQDTFAKYLEWRVHYWSNHEVKPSEMNIGKHNRGGVYNIRKKPTATTLKADRQLLMQVLRWACERDILDVPPSISSNMETYSIKRHLNWKKTRGRVIPDAHFLKIMGKLRSWAGDTESDKHSVRLWSRQRLYYFILICNAAVLRQGTEALRLHWYDFNRIKSKKGNHWIGYFTVRDGKKQRLGHDDSIKFLTFNGLQYLLEWRKISVANGLGRNDDLIFPKITGEELPSHYLSRQFRRLIDGWGVGKDKQGTNITLYSFRHTKISRLLIHSQRPITEVATLADTSAANVSNTYFQAQMLADADKFSDHTKSRSIENYITDEDAKRIEDEMKKFGM